MNWRVNTKKPIDPTSMTQWGQLGTGTYDDGIGVPQLDFFSQPGVPQDWSSALMMGPPKSAMGAGPSIPMKGATGGVTPIDSNWYDGMLGSDGWGGLALNAAGGLASTFLGMKQYGLAKQTLAENKRQFQLNYDAQKQTTNTRLEDRQRARVASNAGAYQSVGDYMAVNGIK